VSWLVALREKKGHFMARRPSQHAHQTEGPPVGEPRPGSGEKEGGWLRSGLTRRAFLVRGSLAAGAAAVIGSVPGVGNVLTTAEADAPEMEGGGGSAAGAGAEFGPTMSQPIVAHVVNLGTGEINFYQGTAQVVARNPGLAQAIARLTAGRS
jgi:hypothetical protein